MTSNGCFLPATKDILKKLVDTLIFEKNRRKIVILVFRKGTGRTCLCL